MSSRKARSLNNSEFGSLSGFGEPITPNRVPLLQSGIAISDDLREKLTRLFGLPEGEPNEPDLDVTDLD